MTRIAYLVIRSKLRSKVYYRDPVDRLRAAITAKALFSQFYQRFRYYDVSAKI